MAPAGIMKKILSSSHKMIRAIEGKREALGINKKQDRVLFDMEMRRDLTTGHAGIPGLGCGQK